MFTHVASLGNGLDFIAVNNAATIGKGAGGTPAGNGSCRLFPGSVNDFKGAYALVFLFFGMGNKAHACSVRSQFPVGGQGNQSTAIGATDSAGEEITKNLRIRGLFGKNTIIQRFRVSNKGFSNTVKLLYDSCSV